MRQKGLTVPPKPVRTPVAAASPCVVVADSDSDSDSDDGPMLVVEAHLTPEGWHRGPPDGSYASGSTDQTAWHPTVHEPEMEDQEPGTVDQTAWHPTPPEPETEPSPVPPAPAMDVLARGNINLLHRPCVDCDRRAGCYCDDCQAVTRLSDELWALSQQTPLCTVCDRA